MNISLKYILTFLLILLSISLLVLFLPFANSSKTVRYDNKCKETVNYVITDKYKIARIHNEFDVSLGQIEEFSHRYYLFEQFMHYMRYVEFKNKPHHSIAPYVEAINKYKKIEDVAITKLIPEYKEKFLEKKYRNLTMRSIRLLSDIDKDGLPEINTSSINARCTKSYKNYYIKSTSINFNKKRNYLESIAVKIIDNDLLYDNELKSNLEKYKKTTNFNGNEIYKGNINTIYNFNQKVVNQEEINNGKNNFTIINKNRLILSAKKSIISKNFILNINKDNKLEILNKKDLSKVYIKELQNIFFNNIYCFQKLDDINENGIQEFLVCNKKTIYLIEPTPSKINFLKVTSDFRNNRLSFGSVGDYNSDRIKDFWVVNPYYKSGIDEKVTGYAGLIDGKKILASFNSKKEKIQLNELIIKEIYGSNKIPNSEVSGYKLANTSIGYKISNKAGDHDNDGINDFVLMMHYSYSKAGSLHILSGKDLQKMPKKILLNEKDFKYVISSFLSYLGPGLFTGYDFNKDGYDDIVVSADMDHEAGYAAGAIYILSGKKIFN